MPPSSALSTDQDTVSSNISDRDQPVYLDNSPIQWDGNPAHIEGALHEAGKYYVRNGLFQALIKHNAVLLSNGKTAVESLNAVPFVTGQLTYGTGHTFDDPCPPTRERIALYNATHAGTASPFKPIDKIPDAITNIQISMMAVQKESSHYHRSLMYIISDPAIAEELSDKSEGCGLRLQILMKAKRDEADQTDRTLVCTTLDAFVSRGLGGQELSLATINPFVKELNKLNRNMPPSKKKDEKVCMNME